MWMTLRFNHLSTEDTLRIDFLLRVTTQILVGEALARLLKKVVELCVYEISKLCANTSDFSALMSVL